jgi:hypothetical protein
MATATSTVRVSESTRRAIKDLSEVEKVPMQTVLERAVETYRRERFLAAANRTYAALKANPQAWKDELAERALWDNSLTDGNE